MSEFRKRLNTIHTRVQEVRSDLGCNVFPDGAGALPQIIEDLADQVRDLVEALKEQHGGEL